MGHIGKSTGKCYLLDRQCLVGQKVSCLIQSNLNQIVVRGAVEELFIVRIKLALFQVDPVAELFGGPVFFIMTQHFHAKCLKILVQPLFFRVVSLSFLQTTGCCDQKLTDQRTLHRLGMGTTGDVFLLQLA